MNLDNHDTLYFIFFTVIRLHYKRSHMLFEKVSLYPGQPPLLLSLYMKDGQSQKDLADVLGIKPATITVMLGRAEKSGLVERRQDITDKRVTRVYLTQKGRKISEEVNKMIKILSSECFESFTDEEKVILRRLLMQVKDNLLIACDKG